MILLYLGVAVYVASIYWSDYRALREGKPHASPMPGAAPADLGVYIIGAIGALVVLAVETAGELQLGISDEQSTMVWYFVFAIMAAGIVEEVIFRGFLVVENKGRALLVGSIVGFSLLFALIHAHFWEFEMPEDLPGWQLWRGELEWTFTHKAWFTTGILFVNSLWFYALRFGPWNPQRSIFPCMVAHAVSNLGVFAVKWWQGFVDF
ncbi:MAG: type II CAAX prenyl endopeptidase Rce1 family protein [Opitutales bacterium]